MNSIELAGDISGANLKKNERHFVYATGHRGFALSDLDLAGIMNYLEGGGFLLIEDNNGMDYAFRSYWAGTARNITFREVRHSSAGDLLEIPFSFPGGMPKIMKHSGAPAQLLRAYADQKPLDFFYSYSCDLGDGWEEERSHGLTHAQRIQSLRMGCNLINYAKRKNPDLIS